MGESYITWLYPMGAIIFSNNLLFIAIFDAKRALNTKYESETYRRKEMEGEGEEYERWRKEVGGVLEVCGGRGCGTCGYGAEGVY
jgi:hypothetical protein